MALQTEMTYVALRPLRVGGQTRHKGELVPEARSWHNLEAYIRGGRIAAVPRAAVDQEALAQAEEAWEALKTPEPEEVEASEDKTKDELYEQAQELDVEGRSSMTKDELAEAVEEASDEDSDDDETEEADGGAEEGEASVEDELEQYHTGNGWYEVPGSEKKVRRDEALELLTKE